MLCLSLRYCASLLGDFCLPAVYYALKTNIKYNSLKNVEVNMKDKDKHYRAPPLKCAVFVDHDNFVYDQDRCGIKYDKLMEFIENDGMQVVRATTYLAVDTYKEEKDQEYRKERKGYRNEISKTGFKVFTKNIRYFTDAENRVTMKGNVDLDLAVDALLQTDNVDCVYIGTGDGDFLRVVTALQNKGKRVVCFGIENIATMLRDAADRYICLKEEKEALKNIFPNYKTDEDKIEEHHKTKTVVTANNLNRNKADLRQPNPEAFKKKVEKLQKPSLNGAPRLSVPKEEFGTIQRWWFDKGFGFIKPNEDPLPDDKGVYFHVTKVRTDDGIFADNGQVENHYDKGLPVKFRRLQDDNGQVFAVEMILLDEYNDAG